DDVPPAHERWDCSHIREISTPEEKRRFSFFELGQLMFECFVQGMIARYQPCGSRSDRFSPKRLERRLRQSRIRRETQIIVGREVNGVGSVQGDMGAVTLRNRAQYPS